MNEQHPAGHRPAILVVDDEEMLLEVIKTILNRSGKYIVVATNDSTEAQSLLEDGGHLYSILITDIVMPRVDGYELALLARGKNPKIKILGMSGNLGPEGNPGRFDGFINKPFPPQQLIEAVEKLLAG